MDKIQCEKFFIFQSNILGYLKNKYTFALKSTKPIGK